jgi:hypothetical protein
VWLLDDEDSQHTGPHELKGLEVDARDRWEIGDRAGGPASEFTCL